MPYKSKKTGKNEITVYKKDSGEMVGKTTPAKYNAYMAALHIHSGDNAAHGGVVEMPKGEFIEEHERLIPKLKGREREDQMAELKDVRGYAEGGIVSPYPEISQEKEEMEPGGAYDEGNDPEFEGAPHMARGGMIPGEDLEIPSPQIPAPDQNIPNFELPQLRGNLTAGTSDQKAPEPMNFGGGPNLAAVKSPISELPMQNIPRGTMTQTPNIQRLPGMPAGVTADEVSKYIKGMRGQVGQFGAGPQMNLANALEARRNSLGYKATSGLKGFADALMQGVARAGNPGFQQGFENEEANAGAQRLGAMQGANAANIQQINAQMALDAKDPNSVISKSIQKANSATLKALGLTDEQIKSMPADMVSGVISGRIEMSKVQAELELRKEIAAMNAKKQEADIEHEKAQTEQEAAKEILGQKNARILGIPVPFTSGVSGKQREAARNTLSQQMQGGAAPKAPGAITGAEHLEAVGWAQAHPDDPRAKTIMQRAGLALGGNQ